jgi:hypothetical protein
VTSYLSQTGFIPARAQSIQFKAMWGGSLVVSLNGEALSLVPFGGTLYGASVNKFSGSTAELRFTPLPNSPPQAPINNLRLDSIFFSTQPIP